MDALDEEEERNKNRDSLWNQLSALSGGSGNATNKLRKDLLKQIEDLNKEQSVYGFWESGSHLSSALFEEMIFLFI